jgi:hypothetical protein
MWRGGERREEVKKKRILVRGKQSGCKSVCYAVRADAVVRQQVLRGQFKKKIEKNKKWIK